MINQKQIIEDPLWNMIHIKEGTLIKKEYENVEPTGLDYFKKMKINELEDNVHEKFVLEINIR